MLIMLSSPLFAIALSLPASLSLFRTPYLASGEDARLAWAKAHAASFRALDVLGYPPGGRWSEVQFTREHSRTRSTTYACWAHDEMVAFASTDRVLDETSVLSIVVHPHWRGRGSTPG